METNDPDRFVGTAEVPAENQLSPHDEVPHGIAFGAASNEVWGRSPSTSAHEGDVPAEIPAHATAGTHPTEAVPKSDRPAVSAEGGWQSAWNKRDHVPEYPVLGYRQPESESAHAETAPADDDTLRTVRLPGRIALGQTAGRPTPPPEEHHE